MLKSLMQCQPRLFEADLGGASGGTGDDHHSSDDQRTNENDSKKTFSREELAMNVSSQVNKAMDEFKANTLPGLLQEQYEKGKSDAGKSESELEEEQKSERERTLDEREAELNHRDAVNTTRTLLADKGLPSAFADYLADIAGNEQRAAKIEELSKAFNDAVQATVLKKTEGKREQHTGGSGTTSSTDDGAFGKRLAEMAQQSENKSSFFK